MGFEVLGIASQALAAQQLALDVTGNNMANATTPGYHVESVNLTENAPAPDAVMPTTLIGNGVTATAVTRATNAFLSSSVRNETSAVGYATALTQGISQVQNIFQEPQQGGLAEMMNQFNQSWLTLSQNPTSLSARQSVLQDGQTLASTLNGMSSSLQTEEANVNQNITSQVQQINQLAQQIAQLNGQVATVSTSGQQPNDLLDQRGQLLTQLSQLVQVHYANGPAGSLDVYIGSHPLVTGEQTFQMQAQPGPFGNQVPTWTDTQTAVQAQSGSLAGNMALLYQLPPHGATGAASAGYLTSYGQSLDLIAGNLANMVNYYQQQGLNLSGTASTSTGGVTQFFTGTTAGTIAVNSSMTADQIAAATPAAGTATSGPGNGSNALDLYNALTTGPMFYSTVPTSSSPPAGFVPPTSTSSTAPSLASYYQSTVGKVGLDGQNATNQQTDAQNTLTSLNNDLQSVTGVDLNQQSVNMIQEQQSYEAAAKLIAAQQSITQSLLSAVN